MKIAPKTVESFLTKLPAECRTVLCYGPDAGLIRDRSKKISNVFLGTKHDPLALVEWNESALLADPPRLADELSAISMMSPQRVIWVRDASDKITRVVENARTCLNSSVLLILSAGELTPRSSLRAWYEKEFTAAAIACYHDEARDIASLIRKTMEQAQIRLDRETEEYLAQQLGNDRYVTYQELEKLVLFAGDTKTLTLQEAQALVDYNRETDYDDMVVALANRDLRNFDKTLAALLRESAQPVAYLRALQRYFNRLYAIQGQMTQGISAEQIIQSLRPPVFFKQVPILTRHAKEWKPEQIVKALALLAAAELACKTSDLPAIPASTRRLMQITQLR